MNNTNISPVLSKSSIRANAIKFSHLFKDAKSEVSLSHTFWIRFFEIFGVKSERVSAFEMIAKRSSTGKRGWIDLLWPGQMGVEQKSAGENLDAAMTQLLDYYIGMTTAEQPWLLVSCDFQKFHWHNLKTNEYGLFRLEELQDNLELFWWIAGYNAPHQFYGSDEDANLEAAELLSTLHDQLTFSGYGKHETREWLTRILFCLFADDTGIWERAAFHAYIAVHTNPDGSDLGGVLQTIFQILDTPPDERQMHLDEERSEFTYINGDLFKETLKIPFCNGEIRESLLRACTFNWSVISPSIFGSMFQNVMTPVERRELGAHYTTENNILRLIKPLFLDDLEAELANANSRHKIRSYLKKLSTLSFFDPACGCGNFLVVAYREIRRLETIAVRKLRILEGRVNQQVLDLTHELNVRVDQYYGIELEEFPAKIARTALYLADHLANRAVSAEFGQHYMRFPIPSAPHIEIGNALRIDWTNILSKEKCNYVFGNPPFVGMSYMSKSQQSDNRYTFASKMASGLRSGRFDYVVCWYAKALDYAKDSNIKCAFVSTNSISQGEQARSIGPLFDRYGFNIDFAHRSFKWTSEARGKAQVTVVIVGFSHGHTDKLKRLYSYPDLMKDGIETNPIHINWYLLDGPSVYPEKRKAPFISVLPKARQGNKPWDGGGLIVEAKDYLFVSQDIIAAQYIKPFRQSKEMLYNKQRWCLWLVNAAPNHLKQSQVLMQRLLIVKNTRLKCKTKSVNAQASVPSLFSQIRQPRNRYLAFPEVSGENRKYIPAQYYDSDVIAGNKLITIEGAPLWLFGVLHSSMFMAWVRTVVGRLETRYSLSPDIAYNAFPFPEINVAVKNNIENAANEVIRQRSLHVGSTLNDLYDENTMPPGLVHAHNSLDKCVDAAYTRNRRLSNDTDRFDILFKRYLELLRKDNLQLIDGAE